MSSSTSLCPSSRRRQAPFSVASLSALLDTVQSHDELLATQHNQQRQHSAAIIEQLRALHSFCSELQHRNTALSSDFDGLTAVHRQLQAQYNNTTAANCALQSELTQCRREKKEEAERLDVERIRQAAAAAELSQQLMALTSSHQQQQQALSTATRERDALQRRIASLEEELADSTAECEQLTSQLSATEEERDEYVEESTRLDGRLKASETERERMAEAKERVEQELQAHLDIAATIHGLSRKAMASRETSKQRAVPCESDTTERTIKPRSRSILGELNVNRP